MEEVTTATAESTQDAKASTETTESKQTEAKQPDMESLIRREVDRATNKLGNENKRLRAEIEEMKRAHMSDDERREAAFREREEAFAERERELADKEHRLVAIKAIKEVGLDDGSELSLALVDFVMAEDEDIIKERVKTFDALVKRMVQSEVDKVFKSSGRVPGKGSTTTSEADPKTDSVAVRMGQKTAKANQAARSTLEYYTGGKKR